MFRKSFFLFFLFFILLSSFVSAETTILNFTASTSIYTWLVPANVINITVEAWGGGGTGGSTVTNSNVGAGGGGAGSYVRSVINVVENQNISINVASARSHSGSSNTNGLPGFNSTVSNTSGGGILVRGTGGLPGLSGGNSGVGGSATLSGAVGQIQYIGGHGATRPQSDYSGAGGGGAGSTGAGGNASGITAGTGTAEGGNGGAGRTGNGVGNTGSAYGGGGSGSRRSATGGQGAEGFVRITYDTVEEPSEESATDYTLVDRSFGSLNNISITRDVVYDNSAENYLWNTVSSGMNISYNSALRLVNGGTISMWVKPLTAGGGNLGRILDNNPGGYNIYMRTTQQITWEQNATSGLWSGTDTVPFNTWSHITLIYNSSGRWVYVNGISVNSSNLATYLEDTNTPLFIGNRLDGTRAFNGSMDDIRIWNISLSDEEINYIYQNYTVQYDSLIAWYPFTNASTVTPVYPPSGNPCLYSGSGDWNITQNCNISVNTNLLSNRLHICEGCILRVNSTISNFSFGVVANAFLFGQSSGRLVS